MRLPLLVFLASTLTLFAEDAVTRIAFGSCMKQTRKAPIFKAISASQPQLFIWLGDNIYGDSSKPTVLAKKWNDLAEHPDYKAFSKHTPIIATWDDHDYGKNDAGTEFSIKDESQSAFLDWLNTPADSPLRQRKGVYSVHDFGPKDKLLRVILLDTRYHRDSIGSNGTILGEEQWSWLEKQLKNSTAKVVLIGSSIQVLATEHRFEKWANFPQERARLLKLLSDPTVPPVIILSGDRHLAEISVDTNHPYPLYDITSSSLNSSFGGNKNEVNTLRLGKNYGGTNFGSISIDWHLTPPVITLAVRDQYGAPQRSTSFQLEKPTHQ